MRRYFVFVSALSARRGKIGPLLALAVPHSLFDLSAVAARSVEQGFTFLLRQKSS